jgi:hypothetical protein
MKDFIGKTGDSEIKKLGHTHNGMQGTDPYVRKQRGTAVTDLGIKTSK